MVNSDVAIATQMAEATPGRAVWRRAIENRKNASRPHTAKST